MKNKPVIMGRTTFETIGKPLPGRTIVVLDQDAFKNEIVRHGDSSYYIAGNVQAAYEYIYLTSFFGWHPRDSFFLEIMIAGGASTYRHFLDYENVSKIYLNRIHDVDVQKDLMVEDSRLYFPDYYFIVNEEGWKKTEEEVFEEEGFTAETYIPVPEDQNDSSL
jgi:dihydrofolate reductase